MMPGRRCGRHDRMLHVDLIRLWDVYNVECLVTLVQEQREMIDRMHYESAEEFFTAVRQHSIETYHCPIRDKWLPDYDALCRCVDWIVHNWREDGKQIVIHCAGGKGRAGTVAACVMYALQRDVLSKRMESDSIPFAHLSMSQIIQVIQNARAGTLRNPIQRIFLLWQFPKIWERWKRRKEQ